MAVLKEMPRLSAGPSSKAAPELPIGFLLLAGLVLSTLLLLPRLLLPTTLLARFLVRVLGLLARILVRVAHSGLLCWSNPS